jgi:hypothetical protein
MGLSSARARCSASSPQGYQSTGLPACWRRYGEASWDRRLGGGCGVLMRSSLTGPRRDDAEGYVVVVVPPSTTSTWPVT